MLLQFVLQGDEFQRRGGGRGDVGQGGKNVLFGILTVSFFCKCRLFGVSLPPAQSNLQRMAGYKFSSLRCNSLVPKGSCALSNILMYYVPGGVGGLVDGLVNHLTERLNERTNEPMNERTNSFWVMQPNCTSNWWLHLVHGTSDRRSGRQTTPSKALAWSAKTISNGEPTKITTILVQQPQHKLLAYIDDGWITEEKMESWTAHSF